MLTTKEWDTVHEQCVNIDRQCRDAIAEVAGSPAILAVIHTMYPYDEDGCPINNLNDMPIMRKVRFHWIDGEGEDHSTGVLFSPRWIDIIVAINIMIYRVLRVDNKFDPMQMEDYSIESTENGIIQAYIELH